MAATINLCLSNSPLLVLLNEVIVIDSISWSTLFARDLGDKGSSIISPSPASFLVLIVKSFLESFYS